MRANVEINCTIINDENNIVFSKITLKDVESKDCLEFFKELFNEFAKTSYSIADISSLDIDDLL